jgi:large subunit ribosomal protein L15
MSKMKYNELKIKAFKRPKRVGRGIAAGQGKTAGRGTKGQNSRAGGGVRPGFEGGQNPLMQRFPKLRGFTSHRRPTETVYTGKLNNLKASSIDSSILAKAGLISSPYVRVKLVLNGKIDKKFEVKLQSISSGAQAALKKAGGSFNVVPQLLRPATKEKAGK